MAAPLAGALPKAKAATPGRCRRRRRRLQGPKLPRPRQERGRPPRCGQKSGERRRSALQRSSGARGKLEASRGQSRPLEPPYPHGDSIRGPPEQDARAQPTALLDRGFPSTVTRRPISTWLELQCWLAGGLAFSSTASLEVLAAAAIVAGHAVAAHTGAPARLLAAGAGPTRCRPGTVCP